VFATALAHAGHREAFRESLARGTMSLKTSCARRLNRLEGRRGAVFADRYHAQYLRSPRQVRHAIA